MANYMSRLRTNYFAVTDEEKFRNIMGLCLGAEEDVKVYTSEKQTGKFAFGCVGGLLGIPLDEGDTDTADLDCFYEALQDVLVEGDAILITEIGHEKMRYLTGWCTIITKKDIGHVDIKAAALETVRSMLGDPKFQTQNEY